MPPVMKPAAPPAHLFHSKPRYEWDSENDHLCKALGQNDADCVACADYVADPFGLMSYCEEVDQDY